MQTDDEPPINTCKLLTHVKTFDLGLRMTAISKHEWTVIGVVLLVSKLAVILRLIIAGSTRAYFTPRVKLFLPSHPTVITVGYRIIYSLDLSCSNI